MSIAGVCGACGKDVEMDSTRPGYLRHHLPPSRQRGDPAVECPGWEVEPFLVASVDLPGRHRSHDLDVTAKVFTVYWDEDDSDSLCATASAMRDAADWIESSDEISGLMGIQLNPEPLDGPPAVDVTVFWQ